MPLDLLVPDLLLPQDAPPSSRAVRLSALEKWLARADIERRAERGAAEWLAARFELPAPAPFAAIALAGEGREPPEGAWLRADPVHLAIDQDRLKLHDAAALGVGKDESLALVAALQAHFSGDGFEFRAVAPDRWYVRVPEALLPRTTPLEAALGRDVYELLATLSPALHHSIPAPEGTPGGGRASFNWRSALTEAQMVMAGHPVNAAREAARMPTINSVWFWGEGSMPQTTGRPYVLVHSDDAFARGLGELSGAEVRPQARGIAEVDLVREDETALATVGDLTPELRRGDEARWKAAAEALEAKWFAGLGEAIARFGRVRVVLPAETGTRVATLTAAARWRWFRARKPLAAHA